MHSAERLLKLLGLLEGRIDWTADDLARRLEVTPRTVRRDITRLRDLGYPVEAMAGPGGGYPRACCRRRGGGGGGRALFASAPPPRRWRPGRRIVVRPLQAGARLASK